MINPSAAVIQQMNEFKTQLQNIGFKKIEWINLPQVDLTNYLYIISQVAKDFPALADILCAETELWRHYTNRTIPVIFGSWKERLVIGYFSQSETLMKGRRQIQFITTENYIEVYKRYSMFNPA